MSHSNDTRSVWIGNAKRVGVLALLLIGFALPAFVETNYSQTVYPVISQTQRLISGAMPINFGDLLYIGAVLYCLVMLYDVVRAKLRKELRKEYFWLESAYNVQKLIIVVIVFYVVWGLNYARVGITAQMPVKSEPYTSKQLAHLVRLNVLEANKQRALLNDTTPFPGMNTVFQKVSEAYQELALNNPAMNYEEPAIKKSWFGGLITKMGVTGYYSPFTGEAVVNPRTPAPAVAFVAAHEVAHQLGYASEDEANFISYYVCTNSNMPLLAYSAHLEMLFYSLGQLARTDTAAARAALEQLSPAIQGDMREFKKFDLASRGWINHATDAVYGSFLSANQQNGLESYRQCVALAINYHKFPDAGNLPGDQNTKLAAKKNGKKGKQKAGPGQEMKVVAAKSDSSTSYSR